MMDVSIRRETEGDFRAVEELTKRAFWNHHTPGCDEHFLVHRLRSHPDFVPELDFVAEHRGRIVGSILYARSRIEGGGKAIETLTFGPLAVEPEFQRKGVGSRLIEHTVARARGMECPAIIIYGDPGNYVQRGFKGAKLYGIGNEAGDHPAGLLVLALDPGAIAGGPWVFKESGAYSIDPAEAEEFDKGFPPMEKAWRPSQEVFAILSNSFVR